jgi:hypothetical protein
MSLGTAKLTFNKNKTLQKSQQHSARANAAFRRRDAALDGNDVRGRSAADRKLRGIQAK